MDNNNFDIYGDLQLIALNNHSNPDENFFYRRLCRWFSSEFSVSIFEVEKHPLEELLLHYFEHRLDRMEPEDLAKHKKFLLYKEKVIDEDDADEEYAERMEFELIKKHQAELNKKNKAKKEEIKNVPENIPDIQIKF